MIQYYCSGEITTIKVGDKMNHYIVKQFLLRRTTKKTILDIWLTISNQILYLKTTRTTGKKWSKVSNKMFKIN